VGIVAQLSGVVTKNGGNIESGRMTKLGGEFCVMMLVTVPPSSEARLSDALRKIEGMSVGLKKTQPASSSSPKSAVGVRQRVVKLSGTDQPGILNGITEYFAKNNITVDDMITYPESAPFSATPLFHMRAVVGVPAQYNTAKLESDIAEVGDRLGVDVWVESFKPQVARE
jgi:glycine cleavage system transcriptional repressor